MNNTAITSKEEAEKIIQSEDPVLWVGKPVIDHSNTDASYVKLDGCVSKKGLEALLFLMNVEIKEALQSE